MRTAYRVLASLVALLVVVQAAAIAYAVSGLTAWVADGGTLDAAAMESGEELFPEVVGFIVHGMNGMMLIPAVALALVVVSFFARVPQGVAWAGGVLGLVVVQVLLGMFAGGLPLAGLLHGVNALVLLGVASQAARRARTAAPAAVTSQADGARTVRAV